jgi:hypothetical protein
MKIKLALSLSLLFLTSATAVVIPDTPSVHWQQSYNCHDSGGSETDAGTILVPLSDNRGLYVGGNTNSLGPNSYDIWDNYDACIIKLDAQGKKLWCRTFGIKGNGTKGSDMMKALSETADGGVIGAASTSDTNNMQLALFGADGSPRWQKTIVAGYRYTIGAIHQTSDGGFIMTGGVEGPRWTGNVVWIVKLDQAGTLVWEKKYASGSSNGIGLIPVNSPDSLIVVADVDSSNYNHAWFLKIGPNGDTVWTKRYYNLHPVRAAKAGVNHFLIASTSDPANPQRRTAQVAKFSLQGDSLWTRFVNRMEITNGRDVTMLSDGNVLFAGTCNNTAYTSKGSWLQCMGPDGDSLWSSDFLNKDLYISAVCSLDSGTFAVTGAGVPDGYRGSADIWVLKGKNGTSTLYENFFGGRSTDLPLSIVMRERGSLIFGTTQMYNRTSTVAIRVNEKGETLWKKEVPFQIGKQFNISCDSLLFAGCDSSGFFWVCIDTLANYRWKKTVHHDTSRSYYRTCFPSSSGGYYLVGSVNYWDGILVRLDNSGNELWSKIYKGNYIYDGLQKNDKNIVLLTENAQIIGTDSLGNVEWKRSIPQPDSILNQLHGTALVQTSDGRLTVFSGIGAGPYDQYIYQMDSAGNPLWSRVYTNKYPWSEKVKVVNGNEFLITGATIGSEDKYIAYLDSTGAFKWEKTFTDNDSLRDMITDFYITPSGTILALCSEEDKEFKDWDIVLTELGEKLQVRSADKNVKQPVGPQLIIRKNRISVNFGVNQLQEQRVTIGIYLLDGKCVYRHVIDVKSPELELTGMQRPNINSGVYVIRISTPAQQWIYKTSIIQ